MKLLYTAFLFFITVLSSDAAAFEKLVTPSDLGYSDSAGIIYTEKIDEEYIGIFVQQIRKGMRQIDYWIYHPESKQATNLTYVPGGDYAASAQFDFYGHTMTSYGISSFARIGDEIYNIVQEQNDDNPTNGWGWYLQTSNLLTGEKKITGLGDTYLSSMCGLVVSGQEVFLINMQGYYEDDFEIYSFGEDGAQKQMGISAVDGLSFSNIEPWMPFFHNGMIYLSANDQLYVFNTLTKETDTLINDTRDVKGVALGAISVPSQYLVYGNNVYVVYRDVMSLFGMVFQESGFSRIWKTDGTKSGTRMVNRVNPQQEIETNLYLSKLVEMDGQLYWLGGLDTISKASKIYKFNQGELEFIGNIDFSKKHEPNFSMYFFSSHLNMAGEKQSMADPLDIISHKGKDVLVLGYGNSYDELYLNLVSIGNEGVEYVLKDYPIVGGASDSILFSCEVFGLDSDKIGISIVTGTQDHGTLKLISSDDFLHGEVGTIEISHTNGYNMALDAGNQLLFIFGDGDKDSEYILWSLDKESVTSVNNHLSEAERFLIYPNPASKSITAQSEKPFNGNLMIIGVDGKIHQILRVNGYQQQVNTSQLSNGIYIVVYQGNGGVSSQRIVITK